MCSPAFFSSTPKLLNTATASSIPWNTRAFDLVIVGAGAAGLYTALGLPLDWSVALITKDEISLSASDWAQGGIAAVTAPDDSVLLHQDDTLRAGAGLCEPKAVDFLVSQATSCVQDLVALGVAFDRHPKDKQQLALTREAAHSRSRVLHAADTTGRAVVTTLTSQVLQRSNIQVISQAFVLDLWMLEGRCQGICLVHQGILHWLRAGAVVLATGGGGQVFAHTTNPELSTGDGIAIAYRAGAQLRDLEFFQFHPTALMIPGAPRFLISEAVRGEGAHVLDRSGQRFLFQYHPDGELAPRDVVSRSIFQHLQAQNLQAQNLQAQAHQSPHDQAQVHQSQPYPAQDQVQAHQSQYHQSQYHQSQTVDTLGSNPSLEHQRVWLDLRPIPRDRIHHRFPNIIQVCQQWGVDPLQAPIPVAPAAHYWMGGITTDLLGQTSIPGLYAIGETASTGVHGANRLASNSLLECLVFGRQLAQIPRPQISQPLCQQQSLVDLLQAKLSTAWVIDHSPEHHTWIEQTRQQLRQLVWASAGICRECSRMEQAIAQVRTWQDQFARLPLTQKLRQLSLNPETTLQLAQVRAREMDGQEGNQQEGNQQDANPERLGQQVRLWGELDNLLTVAQLLLKSAHFRQESRGGHYRGDYPHTDPQWQVHTVIEGDRWSQVPLQ